MSVDIPFLRSFFRAVTDRPIEFGEGEPEAYYYLVSWIGSKRVCYV